MTQKRRRRRHRASNKPNRKNSLVLKDGEYLITHYTFALESDPIYDNSKQIVVPGLDKSETYKHDFIYGHRGVIMQGTGRAINGKYITIDWGKKKWTFKYDVGATVIDWKTVAADPAVLSRGTQIEIEIYKDKGTFTVTDTGGAIKGHHIDVFVGAITVAEANALGTKKSKVTIVK
jgi:3D (Asp-Asp-Asp) domain-containing protein